ncbi:MAG TPA: glycosyltransferase [Sphingomonas sp.]|uniref:glycosyltransferase n=1 Tax=Sphingomonas sp. TaxID=28214 RepID=UPI002BA7489C|nr:glycosyltransferase [Sphingomonas sp.]HMI20838.1 glycosyltransferase [Sphingomonas sp.]
MTDAPPRTSAIAYVAARLPTLSETFVYRELMGLRSRGRTIVPVTVRKPVGPFADPALNALAGEATRVYSWRSALALVPAFLIRPLAFMRIYDEACAVDLDSAKARLKFMFQAWMGLATAFRLRGRGIGHVHAHLANTPATVGLYLARGLRVPFSFTGHANDLFVHREALQFKLEEAAFVSSISRWHQRFYDDIAPGGSRPVIRCSVTMPELAGDGANIVSVGRLVPKKGFDLLIKAFARLDRAGQRLIIAGDGPERRALVALAEAEGVADHVDFLGSRPHAEALAVIRSGAVFALPCRTSSTGDRDGIPVVLMEAMAAGKPVIAGRLETIAELVEDGNSGLLVPPDDVAALTRALQALVDDPAKGRKMGLAGRKRVAEEFSDAINWDRLEAAIDAAKDKK